MFVRYARRIRRGTPTSAGASHFVTRNLSASPSPDDERSVSIVGDDGEVEARTPWKTLLEMPARASWRVSTAHLPQPLADAQDNLLNETYRSKKQLHKTNQDVMITHKGLADRRERERMRTVGNREYKKKEKKRDEAVHPVFYGPDETLANLKFRLHPNYAVSKRVLEECRSLIGRETWSPKRVIDFGVGCGSASAATMDVWDDIEWIHGIDPSHTMREGAKALLDDLSSQGEQRNAPRITMSTHLTAEASSTTFDLALFAYTATELPHGVSTLAAAAILWGKLRPGGILVMIEPGTPDGFSSIRTVRSMLLDCCRPDGKVEGEEECHILAPCPHNGPCPMERFALNRRDDGNDESDNESDEDEEDDDGNDNDDKDLTTRSGFCSFVQTMPGGKTRSKGEKFSYIVAQKRICGESLEDPHPFDDVNITELLIRTKAAAKSEIEDTTNVELERLQRDAVEIEARYLDADEDHLGLELLRGDRKRSSFGRIIQAPRKKKGHVLIDCCTAPGRIVTHIIPKSMSNAAPGVYSAARKSRWGGFWPDLDHVSK
jgi:ribosomal protein RSM22 (predicted rRNA methylase)